MEHRQESRCPSEIHVEYLKTHLKSATVELICWGKKQQWFISRNNCDIRLE
jgi:hypothetical protein